MSTRIPLEDHGAGIHPQVQLVPPDSDEPVGIDVVTLERRQRSRRCRRPSPDQRPRVARTDMNAGASVASAATMPLATRTLR